jgi:peptidoglycan/xylan/chitin deacetylase (PgdA/CDA1 family)
MLLLQSRKYIIVFTVLLTLITVGCQVAQEPSPDTEQQSGEDNNKRQFVEGTPQMEGGSELTQREQTPVSNYKLQQKYPSVVVLRGNLDSNQIALTFDDGPDPRYTPQVLDKLKKHGVKATFFVMGSRANAHREIMKRTISEGHEIGNHSYWHPNFPKEELGRINWEINETDRVLEDVVGYKPRLFRAPYGALNEGLVERLIDLNNIAVTWSVDSTDWMQLTSEQVQKNVLGNVHPGAIILMHDGGHWTMDLSGMIKSLDVIIPKLKGDGMKFVTIPEMFNTTNRK